MQKEIISNSEEETAKFAAEIAKDTRPGTVIALHGSLGAGKSVFSRGFARGCGIKGPIPSPTFTIVQEYRISDDNNQVKEGLSRLYHMDLYRIQDAEAGYVFGIDEYLDDVSAVKLIEWPERIEEILPPDTVNIKIEHIDEDRRKIVVDNI
jgi:tRNA threonylcarbamoyladenosine biosynthesis protein TsaE